MAGDLWKGGEAGYAAQKQELGKPGAVLSLLKPQDLKSLLPIMASHHGPILGPR